MYWTETLIWYIQTNKSYPVQCDKNIIKSTVDIFGLTSAPITISLGKVPWQSQYHERGKICGNYGMRNETMLIPLLSHHSLISLRSAANMYASLGCRLSAFNHTCKALPQYFLLKGKSRVLTEQCSSFILFELNESRTIHTVILQFFVISCN